MKIAIVGSGIVARTLAHELKADLLITPEEAKQFTFQEPIIISNPYPIDILKEDKFICKGKHQYREVKTTENGRELIVCLFL